MRLKDRFGGYLTYLKQKGLTDKTIKEHRRFLLGAISHAKGIPEKEVSILKLVDVASIIEAGREHGEYGAQRAVCVFRRYLKFLKESGIKLPFDWRDVELPKVPHKEPVVLDEQELSEVLGAFPLNSPNTGARRMAWTMRTLCEVLFVTGMRISEALSLKRSHWPEIRDKGEIIIAGKGRTERVILFSKRAIDWLNMYLDQRKDDSDSLFVNSYGDPLKRVTAKSYIIRFRKKLGLMGRKVKFHTFRRTLATILFERGANIRDVQSILGHKSERTTLKWYVRMNRGRAKKVHRRILAKV